MAKTNIEVDLLIKDGDSVANVEKKAVSLKQQLKEMKALLASGTLDKGAFDKLAVEAGKLEDRIGDVNQRVRNLASDSQKLDGFVSLASGIVGGFTAVQGITALVGEENEDLQKTMVKLQGTMAALTGIQAVANTLNKDSAALTALQTIRMGALTAAQTAYTFVVGTSTGALKLFKIALAATGIGLIIIALAKAAEMMGAFGDETSKTTKQIEEQTAALEKQAAKFKEGDHLLLERYRQEADIAKAQAKLRGASNEEILQIERNFLIQKRGLLQLEVDDVKKSETLRAKARQELAKVENDLILGGLEKEQAAKEARDKKQDEAAAKEKARLEKKAENETAFERARREVLQDLEDLDTKAADKKKEDDEKEVESQKERAETTRQWRVENAAKDAALEKQIKEQAIAETNAMWAAKTSIAQSGYSVLNTLGDLALGQQFKQTAAGKVLAVAQIATDTALAYISGLRIAQQSAAGTGPGAAFAFPVFYASQVASIIGAVAKAKSALSGGSGGGSVGGAPSFGGFNTQPPPIKGFATGGNKKADPVEVFIYENKITEATGRVARIKQNAEIV